ncbi:hypothetical protein BKA70DRAFT_409099 [Coprinopsis sp. MPI-PUGE-AT-0042]|nr:hypothetical protein BKA70DRAFT_409099 [Coprinopsis sp. MPI-PUGE-AT-0042]
MLTIRTLVLAGLSASFAFAQRNVTVTNTDPSITYEGDDVSDSTVCRYENGNLVPGQRGCYNFGPELCTESVTMGRGDDSFASFTFKGSAIYVNSGRYRLSPLYTITLDGQAEDVDGFSESGPFTCQLLFSRTGLDPNVDHTITLAVKGPSPQDNSTEDSNTVRTFNFSLIDFTYTVEGSANSTSPSQPANGSSTTGPGVSASSGAPGTSPSEGADESEGAGVALSTPVYVALGMFYACSSSLAVSSRS